MGVLRGIRERGRHLLQSPQDPILVQSRGNPQQRADSGRFEYVVPRFFADFARHLTCSIVNLPSDINDILDLIKIVSRVMFGFFLTSACLSFVLMFLMPISIISRWWTLPVAILTFINALLCTAASVIATVMFVIFRNVISSVRELNISSSIGNYLFGFMWTASAFAIFAWLVQTGLCCCCASRRDVKTGRKRGSKKAYQMAENAPTDGVEMRGADGATQEKSEGKRRFRFGRRKE